MCPKNQEKRNSKKHVNSPGSWLLSSVSVTDCAARTLRDTFLFRLEVWHSSACRKSSLLMLLGPRQQRALLGLWQPQAALSQ